MRTRKMNKKYKKILKEIQQKYFDFDGKFWCGKDD